MGSAHTARNDRVYCLKLRNLPDSSYEMCTAIFERPAGLSLQPGLPLILLSARFFPIPFPRQSFFYTALFTGLQVKRMPLDFFNNVLLLDFTFEATQGVFKRFAFLQSDFSQKNYTSQPHQVGRSEFCSVPMASQGDTLQKLSKNPVTCDGRTRRVS
jgi:hypothetical protein